MDRNRKIVSHSRLLPDVFIHDSKNDMKTKSDIFTIILNLILIIILSGVLTLISLNFASVDTNSSLYESYFKSFLLLFMNFIPIFILMYMIWLVSNKLWLGYMTTMILVVVGSIGNRMKLIYRNDPVIFTDLTLINEAGMMAKKYKIKLTSQEITIIILLVLSVLLIRKFLSKKIKLTRVRVISILLSVIIIVPLFSFAYLDEDVYLKIGDESVINKWLATEKFQSKGFVYPFVYSSKELFRDRLEGYDKKQAIKDLEEYKYEDIAKGKKVNIISIMLEAYNDFSQFDGINVDEDVYKVFHELQEKSVSGNIVTNIFAGGTIDTERAFLTGYQNQPKYRKDTNSFVWYLKEQGYKTEAMHPITGSFYNRRNVNTNLGFDNFDYLENKYEGLAEDYLRDNEFFDFIIKGYEDSKSENKPYFNFSVTYQNHGPYADVKYHEEDFFERKSGYNESDYNIFNNYLRGIKDTGQAIEELVTYFEEEDEPVIIVLFGDHNPWLGENNSVYEMLGIDLNLGEEDGFKNYYQTPYVIWGNDKAKEVTNNKMVKRTEEFGSSYLMAQCFEELGWKGNEYMQYITDIKEILPVQHKEFYKENKTYKKELSEKGKEIWDKYRNIEHYYGRNYNYKGDK